tara:strand:+ start:14881 stop:15768 length:888 start_codon:yes stop_codon:yes gene_type:complete
MKTIVLILLSLSAVITKAQPFNVEVSQEGSSPQLLGKINKEALLSAPYKEWFNKGFEEYEPSEAVISKLKTALSEYTITLFLGTWCGDSKREVPKFYKILDEANFPLQRLTTIGVDRERATYKQSPGGEEEGLNIHRVPTFIFYKDGKEANRIVEFPVTTLEQDILNILQGNGYIPSYNAVKIVNDALVEMGSEKFQKKAYKLIPKLEKEAKKASELNTYANVLFFSERQDEAIVVAQLNTRLFPNEAFVFESLANKLYQRDQFSEALKNYEIALKLDPKNEKVDETIKTLRSKV